MHTEPVEHEQLRRLIGIMLFTSIPLLAFSIYIGLISGSLSVIAVILDSGVALLLNLASFFVLRIVARSNVFHFPYGTGKLENFTSVLHGCSILLVGLTIFYQGFLRLTGPSVTVSLGLAQLPILVGFVRLAFIVWWLARMTRQYPEHSPLLHAYYVNCTASMWYVSGLFLAMLIGWLLSCRWGNSVALALDLIIAAFFSCYLVLNGIPVIIANFQALLDLPLPESDQLQILKVLTHYYDAYAGLGNIFTRYSGGKRRIEIELFFSPDTTAGQMEAIRRQMDNELKQSFGTIEFYLIARCLDS